MNRKTIIGRTLLGLWLLVALPTGETTFDTINISFGSTNAGIGCKTGVDFVRVYDSNAISNLMPPP